MRPFLEKHRNLLVALLLLLVGGGTVAVVVDPGDPGGDDETTTTITVPSIVGGHSQQMVVDEDNQVSRAEKRIVESVEPEPDAVTTTVFPDLHEDARDPTPPGVTQEDVEQIEDGPTEGLGTPRPPAGAQAYDCRPNYVRNRSSRNGQRVKLIVVHFTVSGPGSLRAIWGLFNTPAFGASSTLLWELNGQCEQLIPYAEKPWTQGAFNGVSESVEIVTYDLTRAEWLAAPLIRDGLLAAWIRDRLNANGLPLKLVDPEGCDVQTGGYTDHDRLECGNNHWDVGKNFPWDVLAKQIRLGYRPSPLTKTERGLTSKRCYHRGEHLAAKKGSPAAKKQLGWARYFKQRVRAQMAIIAEAKRQTGKPWSAKVNRKRHRGSRYQILGGYYTGKSCAG